MGEVVKAARDNNMDHSHRVKRHFLAFCALAIVPCGLASGAAARAADDAWAELEHVSAARIARLAGSVVAMDPRSGLPAAITAPGQPEGHGGQSVPLAVRLVLGLLLLFSVVGSWILFAKESGPEGKPAPSHAALVLLACVPLFTLLGMLVHVQRTFDDAAHEGVSRDLAQTLAVVGALGIGESPAEARALSGFHAARIQGGVVTASTLTGDASALEAVPAPPPSFTTSGVVETGAGRSRYVARRIDRESFMVLFAPLPLARVGALRNRLILISGVLVGWLLLVAGGLAVRSNRSENS